MKLKFIANIPKNSLKWLHLALLFVVLYSCSTHVNEVLIVIILMYEIGFEMTAVDKLMDYNNQFRRWMLRKFSRRKTRVSK